MELIIGNKNYSSWSMRAWVMLYENGIAFDENEQQLFSEAFYSEISQYSGAGKVPVLVDEDIAVWDSLSICEYISERHLDGKGWPTDVGQRAIARSISSEMHSGFNALRNECPMNCRAKRKVVLSDDAKTDIARIDEIWSKQMRTYQAEDDWLFGEFSIADAMYIPVVMRFITYGIALSPRSKKYMERVMRSESVVAWLDSALKDESVIPEDEAGEAV
ncbi:glutathione S-transferase family protein [Parasalinivibrio latis]|uniref:glutathione S-transferase family protein n=1 Tax=Parasalinivibrio latis TaxID=2952610 RepID=UPI0030E07BEB